MSDVDSDYSDGYASCASEDVNANLHSFSVEKGAKGRLITKRKSNPKTYSADPTLKQKQYLLECIRKSEQRELCQNLFRHF